MVEAVIGESILRRAAEKELVSYHLIDPREFSEGKFKQIDDYPFGGGTGMIMMPEPILKALDRVENSVPAIGICELFFLLLKANSSHK